MTGEEFLDSIRYLDQEINALDFERVRIMDKRREILESAHPRNGLTGVVVQHSLTSRTEDIGIRLASLMTPEQVAERINRYQRRINRKIDRLVAMKTRALSVIDNIPSAQHRALLTLRYINCYKWGTIAEVMSYNEHYVRVDMKRVAIPAFESVWRNTT